MKFLYIIMLSFLSICYSSSDISLLSIYNKTIFVDLTSSSSKYEADLFGVRLGSSSKNSINYNNIEIDLSLGLGGRRGHDFFSDRPFYLQLRGAYLSLFNIVNIRNIIELGVGAGLEYNLEGFVPTNLYGPSLSWTQTIGGTLALFSRFKLDPNREFSLTFYSPIIGIINRPEWTGPISQEIEELSENSYIDVLMNRGNFFSVIDYQSFNINIVYKRYFSNELYLYIEEAINYSNTDIPREYNKITFKFVFGLNYRVNGY